MLAIAHNGNLSNGRMFPLDRVVHRQAARPRVRRAARASGSALYEATQTKGDGETHPFLSPNDEFADFERWDKGNLDGSVAKKKEMLEFEYARSALKIGLKLEKQLGINPYKFGIIGSTDAHTGLAADGGGQLLRQDDAAGAEPGAHDAQTFINNPKTGVKIMDWEVGLVGLRRGLGDGEHPRGDLRRDGAQGDLRHDRPAHDRALLRRLGFRSRRRAHRNPAASATRRACPWAATCAAAPAGKAPTFLVAALKDPIGANLDRIQIVKGWLDAKGALHEKVYDVAWGRRPQARRRTASCRRSATPWTSRTRPGPTRSARRELITVWTDPSFDPQQRAFYYARVIEIPTPRWTAYDAKRFGVKPLPGTRMTITERAYTSPIWYTPAN